MADLYEKKRTSNGVGPVVVNTQKYTSLFIRVVKIKKKNIFSTSRGIPLPPYYGSATGSTSNEERLYSLKFHRWINNASLFFMMSRSWYTLPADGYGSLPYEIAS